MIQRIVSLVVMVWLLGFVWFAVALPQPAPVTNSDAIVVPTGSGGRIPRGLELLRSGASDRLLITGVDTNVRPEEFAAEYGVSPALMECCLTLGFAALDTRGNARETARWVEREGVGSIRLVTSDWHMRRAALELQGALPPRVSIARDAVRSEPSLWTLFLEYHKMLAAWVSQGFPHLTMQFLRSLAFHLVFYAGTVLFVLAANIALVLDRRRVVPISDSWSGFQRLCLRLFAGISVRETGTRPPGAALYAYKHESFFEAIDLLHALDHPAGFAKQELLRIPGWGKVAAFCGVIPVAREQGAQALRRMVVDGRRFAAQGRPLVIFPEGTRVPHGERPPLQAGFAALYKALNLPVVPVAVDSGRTYGRFRMRRGTIRLHYGEPIPPGLPRAEIERRVREAINIFNS